MPKDLASKMTIATALIALGGAVGSFTTVVAQGVSVVTTVADHEARLKRVEQAIVIIAFTQCAYLRGAAPNLVPPECGGLK
jgi:hypothetical protein